MGGGVEAMVYFHLRDIIRWIINDRLRDKVMGRITGITRVWTKSINAN